MLRQLLADGEPDKFFEFLFKALQEYLGDKFHLTTAGITSNITDSPKLSNIDKEIVYDLKRCFDICDRARYAPSSITKSEMSDTFSLLQKTIDRLERTRV